VVKPHARFIGIHDANFDQRFLLEFVNPDSRGAWFVQLACD